MKKTRTIFSLIVILFVILTNNIVEAKPISVIDDDIIVRPKSFVWTHMVYYGLCGGSEVSVTYSGELTTPGKIVRIERALKLNGEAMLGTNNAGAFVEYRYLDSKGVMHYPVKEQYRIGDVLQRAYGSFGRCPDFTEGWVK